MYGATRTDHDAELDTSLFGDSGSCPGSEKTLHRPSAFNVVRRVRQSPDHVNFLRLPGERQVRFSLRLGIPTLAVFAG